MKIWGVEVETKPLALKGRQLHAGNILMGKDKSGNTVKVPLDPEKDLDRGLQAVMSEQTPLKLWGIFCSDRDLKTAQQFSQTMKQCLD